MTSPSDRDRLRRLAAEYAEMATNAVIDDRREIWRRTNMLEERTVPFQIEDNGTFFADLLPELQCEGAFERGIEAQMVRALTNHRLIDDDRVFPPFLGISWIVGRTSVCPEVEITRAADATGRELGYETNTPMADLANSLHKLVPTESSVNRDETHRLAELAGDLVGDILPVKIIGHHMTYAGTSLAQRAVHLMGMDGFYMAMIDQPENVHAFFEFLAADGERYVDWLEAEGLVTLNNRDLDVGSGSCG
ncbi:MAG TPA: hypothetical protein QGH10_00840, partial [Armatimonadota bacterium]|nr:hypothetical protein [Armatimonadota bacterium]